MQDATGAPFLLLTGPEPGRRVGALRGRPRSRSWSGSRAARGELPRDPDGRPARARRPHPARQLNGPVPRHRGPSGEAPVPQALEALVEYPPPMEAGHDVPGSQRASRTTSRRAYPDAALRVLPKPSPGATGPRAARRAAHGLRTGRTARRRRSTGRSRRATRSSSRLASPQGLESTSTTRRRGRRVPEEHAGPSRWRVLSADEIGLEFEKFPPNGEGRRPDRALSFRSC